MGLLDAFAGQVFQSMGAAGQGPQAQVHPDLVHSIMNMLAGPQTGGLGGLVQSFEQAGLGNLVSSWVSTGQNVPATPQQIQQGVPPHILDGLSQKLGLSTQQLLPMLAMALPIIVDKLSPKGQLPPPAAQQQGLDGLLGSVMGALGR